MTTDEKIKAFGAAAALAGLFWGIFSFIQVQAIEAAKPYLQKKLGWCEEAVKTTSKIAIADPMAAADIAAFWQMYWGVMGLIENDAIKQAMVAFGGALTTATPTGTSPEKPVAPPRVLRKLSLDLAHACRQELSLEWSPRWSRQ